MQQENENNSKSQELVSALVDGELTADELSLALGVLEHDGEAQERWAHYHLVGEALRTQARGAVLPVGDRAFVHRMRSRLAQETAGMDVAPELSGDRVQRPAANDEAWRWKWVAGVCCMALAGMMAWQWSSSPQAPAWAQQERSTAPTVLAVEQQGVVMLRDPRLDQLIAAHQQQGGASPLVMPAGFLRNATYERAGR
jgi:sigma-E factor negative regulatory protein RseA